MSYSEGLYKENMQLRNQVREMTTVLILLINRLGGEVVIDEEDLYDESLTDYSLVTYIDDKDLSRIFRVKAKKN